MHAWASAGERQESQKRRSRNERDPVVALPVEALDDRHAPTIHRHQAVVDGTDSGRASDRECQHLADGDVAGVIGLGKLGDRHSSIGKRHEALGAGPAQRRSRPEQERQIPRRSPVAVHGIGRREQLAEAEERRNHAPRRAEKLRGPGPAKPEGSDPSGVFDRQQVVDRPIRPPFEDTVSHGALDHDPPPAVRPGVGKRSGEPGGVKYAGTER